MLISNSGIDLEPELESASNRIDFFRLFRTLADIRNRKCFLLSRIVGEGDGIDLQHRHSLHNLPDQWLEDTENRSLGANDPVVVKSKRATAPFSVNLRHAPADAVGLFGYEAAIGVPLHTFNAKRYCLIMFGDAGQPDQEELAFIAFDSALIFQRYSDVILTVDSVTRLSERETEIVYWTSEGKTSAEIAAILGLSAHTVNSYIVTALRKLGVVNRSQMVATALRNGVIG